MGIVVSGSPTGGSGSTSGRRVERRVAVTQPYVPGYRERLWSLVIEQLREADVECRIFFGGDRDQEREVAARRDGIEPGWASRVASLTVQPVRSIPKFMFRRLPRTWRGRRVLLVTEMQGTNLNAWLRAGLRQPYITLGHGISATTTQSPLADVAENLLNSSAACALTYTETGRRHVLASTRLREDQVTAFRNSTDTSRLQRAMAGVTPADEAAFRARHGIPTDARVSLFLGALNRFKAIDLLVEAARIVFARDPSQWLVVAGDGESRSLLEELAQETHRVVLLGQAGPPDFAPAAAMSHSLLNPGRVGLVAVDALVMGLRVVTTSGAAHAPEFEYLRQGVDVLEVAPTPEAYARAWIAEEERVAAPVADHPTVEAAARTISTTILDAMGSSRGRRTLRRRRPQMG
jgi:glycosyltransferase involved in cell wall biosynthesis